MVEWELTSNDQPESRETRPQCTVPFMETISGSKWLKLMQVVCLSVLGIALLLTFLNADNLVAARQELAQIEASPALGAAQLRETAAGSLVTVAGTISHLTPAVHRSLVAFVHKEGSTLYSTYWIDLGRITPPLTLDVPDGTVRITNENYGIVNTNASEPDGYFGFEAGSRVLVVGRLRSDSQGPAIEAAFVRGGTYEDYMFERRWSASFLLVLDAALGLITLLAFGLKGAGRTSHPSAAMG